MNKNKTGGIWVGKLKHSKDKIEGIKWYEKPIKTLGVYFGNNAMSCFVYFYLKSLNIFIVSKSWSHDFHWQDKQQSW
jgi:hypothetical protein